MRRGLSTSVVGLAVLLVLTANTLATTWTVAKDGSGDFTEIQDAIDAASPGDLILVKDGEYQGVTVNKPLSIVGSGPGRVIVNDDWNGGYCIRIRELTGGRMLVASLEASGRMPVRVSNSPESDLILWNVVPGFETMDHYAAWTLGTLRHAWLNRVTQPVPGSGLGEVYGGGPLIYQPVLAFVSQCRCQSYDPYEGLFGGDNTPGIHIKGGATAYIAETDAIGGKGGGGWHVDCQIFYPAGDGGDGILVEENAHVKIFGRPETSIQGGAGGDGDDMSWGPGCYPPGGDGGDGIHVQSGEATYSGVSPQGGPGGYGEPPGQDGAPTYGNAFEITPPLPTSTMEGDGKPGTSASFAFHGTPGDFVQVIYSTEIDVFDLPLVDGHPLMPSPTGAFGVIPLGTIDPLGSVEISFQIPPDAPLGAPFFVQGLVTSANHPPQLTNMSMLVVSVP